MNVKHTRAPNENSGGLAAGEAPGAPPTPPDPKVDVEGTAAASWGPNVNGLGCPKEPNVNGARIVGATGVVDVGAGVGVAACKRSIEKSENGRNTTPSPLCHYLPGVESQLVRSFPINAQLCHSRLRNHLHQRAKTKHQIQWC